MSNKQANEQINILENITIQILRGVVREMKVKRKKINTLNKQKIQKEIYQGFEKNEIIEKKPYRRLEMNQKLSLIIKIIYF